MQKLRLTRGSAHAAAPILFVFVLIATCTMPSQDLTPGLAPSQHRCTQHHLTPTSLCTPTPPHPHLPTHHFFFGKIIDPRLCVRFFVKGARSMRPPTPTHLGKVYKRALVVPLSSPHQRAFVCGACLGTAQVGVSLVSLLNPLFKQSRLHCFHICLM